MSDAGERRPAEVLEVRKDSSGEVVAQRLKSTIVGELWLTTNRKTALEIGLIREGDPKTIPVYYLDTGEIGCLKAATPEELRRVHSFKKTFFSPEITHKNAPRVGAGAKAGT